MTAGVLLRTIPEHPVPGRPLGRHVHHDPRSRAFPVRAAAATAVSRRWDRKTPILDQGSTSSCTGNASNGVLGTEPFYSMVMQEQPTWPFDEVGAVTIYSRGTSLDPFPGTYPPTDTGSDGLSVAKACQQLGLISGYLHCLSLDAVVTALQSGPVITGINWYDCHPAGQRVLTSDLRWVPIEKIQIGDELVGFDEHAKFSACYRRSIVTGAESRIRPVVEVVTDRGTVAASEGHLFVLSDRSTGRRWVRAGELRPGDRLAYFTDPVDENRTWEAGYLAGFMDGEGTCGAGSRVDFAQATGPTLDRVVRMLGAMGYDVRTQSVRPEGKDGHPWREVHNMTIAGGYAGGLRFMAEMRPERLLSRAHLLWEGKNTRSRTAPPVTVHEVRRVGEHEVYALGTSTKTLITEGFLSHNCFDQPDSSGRVSISPNAAVRGGHEVEVFGVDMTNRQLWMCQSWGPGWGLSGTFCWSFADYDRLLHEQGDATAFVPPNQPAPAPAVFKPDAADLELAAHATACTRLSRGYRAWKQAKGL